MNLYVSLFTFKFDQKNVVEIWLDMHSEITTSQPYFQV